MELGRETLAARLNRRFAQAAFLVLVVIAVGAAYLLGRQHGEVVGREEAATSVRNDYPAVDLDAGPSATGLDAVVQALDENEQPKVLQALGSLPGQFADAPWYIRMKATAYAKQKKALQALPLAERLIEQWPFAGDVGHALLAEIRSLNGDHSRALLVVEEGLRLHPFSWALTVMRADLLRQSGRAREGMDALTRSIPLGRMPWQRSVSTIKLHIAKAETGEEMDFDQVSREVGQAAARVAMAARASHHGQNTEAITALDEAEEQMHPAMFHYLLDDPAFNLLKIEPSAERFFRANAS